MCLLPVVSEETKHFVSYNGQDMVWFFPTLQVYEVKRLQGTMRGVGRGVTIEEAAIAAINNLVPSPTAYDPFVYTRAAKVRPATVEEVGYGNAGN